jgi:hypothetical protein
MNEKNNLLEYSFWLSLSAFFISLVVSTINSYVFNNLEGITSFYDGIRAICMGSGFYLMYYKKFILPIILIIVIIDVFKNGELNSKIQNKII